MANEHENICTDSYKIISRNNGSLQKNLTEMATLLNQRLILIEVPSLAHQRPSFPSSLAHQPLQNEL